ncbi:MAG: hypothetical protein QOI66_1105 [Myxococcales bacterium]|nr:hypothetical protein [Myxococcales bacterium]
MAFELHRDKFAMNEIRFNFSVIGFVLMVAAGVGCGAGGTATAGSGGAGGGGTGGRDAGSDLGQPDAVDAIDGPGSDSGGGGAFTAVQAIFIAHCMRCHDPAHPVVPETPTFVDTPLTPAAAYDALVGKPAQETCGGTLVTPGDSAKSYLFHKVNDDSPCDGKRMPHPGMLARTTPLSLSELETIASWIQGGARR